MNSNFSFLPVLLLLLAPLFLFASPPPDGRISPDTLPDGDLNDFEIEEVDIERTVTRVNASPCTQYTVPGSTVDLWDWRATSFDIVYKPSNGPILFQNVASPFHSDGVNIKHLGIHAGSGPRDYEPADGWELLYRNLGTPEREVQEPSFGLYNRLDGRIRILFYIEPNDGGSPDNVLVNLRQFEGRLSVKSTALFENLNIPANAISGFDKDIGLGGVVHLNKGVAGFQWYVLETVASYDPCLCQHESSLEIEPVLTYKRSLTFEMEGTGTSSATYDAGKPVSALGYFNGLAGKIYSGYKKYDSFTDYKEESDQNGGKTVKVLSSLLGGFANPVNVASGATELLGFVLGKKSVAKEPKLTGFNHNFSFTANGAERDSSVYTPYTLYTPGSFYHNDQLQANRPIYDNALGVFAVLTAPVVEREEFLTSVVQTSDTRISKHLTLWRFGGDLAYHINSNAGISTRPVQLLASLVWPNECDNREDFYATPAINITCLEEFVVEFEFTEERFTDYSTGEVRTEYSLEGCRGEPELQIVAMLESTGPTPGQEILYSARYKTSTRDLPPGTMGINPFAGMTLEEINNSCTGTIPRQVDGLGRFCDQKYNPDFEKNGLEEAIVVDETLTRNEPVPSDFTAFPNPFVDQLSIEVAEEWTNTPLRFKLHDVLGRLMWERESTIGTAGKYVVADNLGQLPPGTYLMSISGKELVKSLTVQKY